MVRRVFEIALAVAVISLGCSSSDETTDPTPAGGGDVGGGGGGGAGAAPTGDTAAEVTSYHYAFDIDSGAAHSRLTMQIQPPGGDCIEIPCGLPVGPVTWNGQPATEVLTDGTRLRACGAGLAAGEILELGAELVVPLETFHDLDVGFGRSFNRIGGEFSYLLSWLGGCDHFGPCDDDPSKLTELHFEVTHPPGVTALCPGVLTPGDTLSRCDLEGTLAPTYSGFAIAADADWVRTPLLTAAGVDLVLYETPGGPLAASLDSSTVTAFFEWITALLGPYPYGTELRLAAAPIYWGAFEHPANILIDENAPLYNTPYVDYPHHILMHEVVHQWAGNRTTLASALDFVWKEAIANYVKYVFEDEHLSGGEAEASLLYWDEIAMWAEHYPRPTDEPAPEVWDFYGDAYGPGPQVLFVQLESMLGRDTVLQGLQAFLSEPGARSVEDLRDALGVAGSVDLGPYFDAWVFGSGVPDWPSFLVDAQQVGDQVTVTLTQQSSSSHLFGCAVEVLVEGASSSVLGVVDFGVAPSSSSAATVVTLAEPVQSTVVDPNHRVVDDTPAMARGPRGPRPRLWIP